MLLDISFVCGCGKQCASTVNCPEPDFDVERNIDSGVSTEDFVSCVSCRREYRVSITNFQQGVYCAIDDGVVEVIFDVPYYDRDYTDEELAWIITSSADSPLEVFRSQLASVDAILASRLRDDARFSLHVMVYAHIVAAIEGYLSSTFIQTVTNSKELMRVLVETDPEFSNRSISLSNVFKAADSIKVEVASYLQDLIFHKIDKIKPMYLSVLGN